LVVQKRVVGSPEKGSLESRKGYFRVQERVVFYL